MNNSGAHSGQYTPETLRRRAKLAEALLSSQKKPITHWMEGVGQLAETAVGAHMMRDIERKEAARNASFGKMADALLGRQAGAGPSPDATTPGQPMPPFVPSPSAPMSSTNGKVYTNDEPSPLDPPSGRDRDLMARTVIAESGNQPQVGQDAVASVIRNRAVNGGFGGDTPTGVVTARNQFEPWNTAAGRTRMASIDPTSPQYQRADTAINRAYAGDDPTNGATHFYAPKAQEQLGRRPPAWDNGRGTDIYDHRFFGGKPGGFAGNQNLGIAGGGQSPVPPQPQVQPQGGQPRVTPEQAQFVRQLLSDPETRAAGIQMLAQFSQPSKTEFKAIGHSPTTGEQQYGFVDERTRAVQPYSPPNNQPQAASTIPPAPPGVDPKVWREAHSKRATSEGMPASFEDSSKLRNEIQSLPSYKNLAQAAPVYRSMTEAAGRDTRAADVNMIYGMAKIMDPGSVVRESEMSIAQAIATLPQQLQATVSSQLSSTGRLTPEVREAIMQEAHSRIGAYQGMFDQDAGNYRGIAQRNRMNVDDVLPNFGKFDPYRRPGALGPQAAATQGQGQFDWRGEPQGGGWIDAGNGVRIREKR